MTPFQTLSLHNLVHTVTAGDNIDLALKQGGAVYAGFDATAPSLHVGHLMIAQTLKLLAEDGVQIIGLVGTGTTQVGDPTGRNSTRPILDHNTISENSKNIAATLVNLIPNIKIVDNAHWLEEQNLLSFLSTVGSRVSVNALVKLDTFAKRLENGESLTLQELFYPILQGFDFANLAKSQGVVLQIGGQDQWTNICEGIDLARKLHGKEVLGLTVPLLTKADGTKMGKTAGGAIWLDGNKTPPFDFWQFWRNVDDDSAKRFWTHFLARHIMPKDINKAKILLANHMTGWVHGVEVAQACNAQAQALFENSGEVKPENVFALTEHTTALKALVMCGLAKSGKDAKRALQERAIRVDGETLCEDINLEGTQCLSVGKKRYRWVSTPT